MEVTRSKNRIARQENARRRNSPQNPGTPNRAPIPHFGLLTQKEQHLVAQTTNAALAGRSEDDLLSLLVLVRRARDKYSKLHRRQGARQVGVDGGRGHAARNNQRTLVKAEVFEQALARVSRHAARAARLQAEELKRERLAAVKAARQGKVHRLRQTPGSGKVSETKHKGRVKKAPTPQQIKIGAATKSTQRRRQAAKDSRNR